MFDDKTERSLDQSEFFRILKIHDCQPTVDLFASRLNAKLPKYVAWTPDPDAWKIDAFSFSWHNQCMYAFPPFSVISKVVMKAARDGADLVLVMPEWTAQPW